jgi:hypothetical protein
MTTITFDTFRFVERLKAAGISEVQAIAFKDAFNDAQADADWATKTDINELRRDMREMEQRLIIKMGALMTVSIGIVAALVKLL